MKYKISVLLLANNDLREIYESLYDFGDDPPKKFRESFDKFIGNIAEMPYMFPEYARNPKYRKATLAYGYSVFYRIDKKDNMVSIYRVLHNKRNIENLL
ncbi:MAG: type II toxin-antitoxin system RelE/ParE family toxin [Oscillospiraceae bacterium]|nr:type II toxin-antitoxin system RelE/ParE family toxin [Oscillospiraceae bacterium]